MENEGKMITKFEDECAGLSSEQEAIQNQRKGSPNKLYQYDQNSVCVCVLSHVQPVMTPWTVGHQDPLSMGFSASLVSPALAGRFFTTVPPEKQLEDVRIQFKRAHEMLSSIN